MSNPTNPTSIRQICLRGFLARKPRAEITKEIQAAHPNSAAARKAAKHIAWHYGDMRKAGLLNPLLAQLAAEAVAAAAAPKA